jgi:uncharacterized protein YjiS (DUF1127 family)
MTMMSHTATQAAIPETSSGLIRRFGIWAHELVAYWDRRAAVKALGQLDDRALRDIGLARCHIERAVQGVTDPELGRLR